MDDNYFQITMGNNVAKYRNIAGFTQPQLAEKIGISTAFISRVERGQKMVRVRTLYRIAEVLSVSCDALLRQDEPSVCLQNIQTLLSNQPHALLPGIEKLIRVCIEQFEAKAVLHELESGEQDTP
ncbi:MAG: helix-turn-helix domain-containing protein [Oscillospiraceae bacterium]|jgi:transcriptional regulator with XRE-family HTH domain|nr:helix-turn-helix domain-containing protein [Oscillospiraceae bacterium]